MWRLCAFSSYRVNTGYYRRIVAILRRAVVYLCPEISAAARRVFESDACPSVLFPHYAQHYTTYRADTLAHTDGSGGRYQFTRLSDRQTTWSLELQ